MRAAWRRDDTSRPAVTSATRWTFEHRGLAIEQGACGRCRPPSTASRTTAPSCGPSPHGSGTRPTEPRLGPADASNRRVWPAPPRRRDEVPRRAPRPRSRCRRRGSGAPLREPPDIALFKRRAQRRWAHRRANTRCSLTRKRAAATRCHPRHRSLLQRRLSGPPLLQWRLAPPLCQLAAMRRQWPWKSMRLDVPLIRRARRASVVDHQRPRMRRCAAAPARRRWCQCQSSSSMRSPST